MIQALFARLFRLVAMILKPDFHLSGRQAEPVGQYLSLLCAQITLHFKPLLQLVDLRLREQNAPLSLRRIRMMMIMIMIL